MKTQFTKINVRETIFTSPAEYLVLGHEANAVGTVHHLATYKTKAAAEKKAAALRTAHGLA